MTGGGAHSVGRLERKEGLSWWAEVVATVSAVVVKVNAQRSIVV